jgi:hypothetical protein
LREIQQVVKPGFGEHEEQFRRMLSLLQQTGVNDHGIIRRYRIRHSQMINAMCRAAASSSSYTPGRETFPADNAHAIKKLFFIVVLMRFVAFVLSKMLPAAHARPKLM